MGGQLRRALAVPSMFESWWQTHRVLRQRERSQIAAELVYTHYMW